MLPIGYVFTETYCITRLLGQGGMACVYEVCHVRLPTRFAVKVITGDISNNPKFQQRFRQEAEILARLKHPHVVHVIDWHQTKEGHPYLVMELLEGEDLAQRLRRTGPLPLAEALPIFLQIGDAMQAAHDQGIIHRDLKPANVFLLSSGAFPNYTKVLDFGIAKTIDARSVVHTKNAELLGTPAYMAPEQARGLPNAASMRSDQFALALVLYEMLSGQAAFHVTGDDLLQTLTRVVLDEPPALPYPQIEPALRRALSKDPQARFGSIREFIAATGALELSVIRPLLLHTRALPAAPADPVPTSAETPQSKVPMAEALRSEFSGQDAEQSTMRPHRAAQAPPSRVLCDGSATPQTLSRPSITGQKVAAPPSIRWPRRLMIGILGSPLVAAGISILVGRWGTYNHGSQPEGMRKLVVPTDTSQIPTVRFSPPPAPQPATPAVSPATPLPTLVPLASAADAAAVAMARRFTDTAARRRGPTGGPRAVPPTPKPQQGAALPAPKGTSQKPDPAAVPALRSGMRRSGHHPSPDNRNASATHAAAAAPGLADGSGELLVRGATTLAQRSFILSCVAKLGSVALGSIALNGLELHRTNKRFFIESNSLGAAAEESLDRCLSEMSEEMLLPRWVRIEGRRRTSEEGRNE